MAAIRDPKPAMRTCSICGRDYALTATTRNSVTCGKGCARVNRQLAKIREVITEVFGPGVTYRIELTVKPTGEK